MRLTKYEPQENSMFPYQLQEDELLDYLGGKDGYAIHITKLKIFDKPKYLCDFSKPYEKDFEGDTLREHLLTRAPQSWCYVEVRYEPKTNQLRFLY